MVGFASQLNARARRPGEAGGNPALSRNREFTKVRPVSKSEHLASASGSIRRGNGTSPRVTP